MSPASSTQLPSKLSTSLLLLRLSSFLVMFMWTIDKFINPKHAAKIFQVFYKIDGLSEVVSYGVGGIQMLIILAFLFGFQRRFSYGLVLGMHLVSTLSSYARYFDPWTKTNLLFFAAWPMLAALTALYLLRDFDGYTLDARKGES